MRRLDVLLAAAVLAALSGSLLYGPALIGDGSARAAAEVRSDPAARTPAAAASLCGPTEKILYSCPFRSRTASVCLGDGRVAYRYGRPGKPELEVASDGKDGRARFGLLRGQINGEQVSIRFVNGQYHYIVYAAVNGDATIRPGAESSGLVVEKAGRTLAHHRCRLSGEYRDGTGLHQAGNFLPGDEDAPWF